MPIFTLRKLVNNNITKTIKDMKASKITSVENILIDTQYYNGASAKKVINALLKELKCALLKGIKAISGNNYGYTDNRLTVKMNTVMEAYQIDILIDAMRQSGIKGNIEALNLNIGGTTATNLEFLLK